MLEVPGWLHEILAEPRSLTSGLAAATRMVGGKERRDLIVDRGLIIRPGVLATSLLEDGYG
jgi:hypothetical protein